MRKIFDLDEMMYEMGFLSTDTGPNVTELREIVDRQMKNGLTYRSAGTWSHECGYAGMKLSAEDRAAAFLEIEKAIEAGRFVEIGPVDSGRTKVNVRDLASKL